MVDWLLRIAAIVLMTIFSMVFIGPVEGYLFPVVDDMKITKTEFAPNGYTRAWGEFDLLRPGCNFAAVEWHQKGARRDIEVDVVFEGGTVEREGGYQEFGPWLIQISPAAVLTDRSYATVYHNCPWRFWTTKTHFYP